MEPCRQKWIARALLALGLALSLAWLARLDFAEKISTNVLDLIPEQERSPEMSLVRAFAGERQARAVFFALETGDAPRRADAAHAFSESLRQSPAFTEVIAMDDSTARNELGRHLFEHRLDLLLPDWLARQRADYETLKPAEPWPAWLAGRTAESLETFLPRPEALAFQELLPADPLLLLP